MTLQIKTIKNTSQLAGMNRLTSFLKMDILQVFRLRQKKLATAKQKNIITLFNNLFSSGFIWWRPSPFLDRSALLNKQCVTQMRTGLSQGKSFSE